MSDPDQRLLTTIEAAAVAHVKPGTIRQWRYRQHLTPHSFDETGHPLYLELHVLEAERDTRRRGRITRR